MVVGVIGASGATVQRMSMAYKWGRDDVWIQSLNLVETCALVPMQQLWGDAQTYPDAVKVIDKFVLLPYPSGLSHDQYRSQVTYSEIFGRTVAY